jgi:hypothetical protein
MRSPSLLGVATHLLQLFSVRVGDRGACRSQRVTPAGRPKQAPVNQRQSDYRAEL